MFLVWGLHLPAGGSSTGEADTIVITYSTAALAPGTYQATIRVIDGLAGDEEPASSAATARRVIVVEKDGRAVVATLEELAVAGYDVRHAPDAATAGRMASEWPPDAVVVRAGDGTAVAWSTGVDAPVLVVDDGSSVSTAAIVAELEAVLAG